MPKRICLTDVPAVYSERILTEILPDTLVPFNDNGSGCVASIPVDFAFKEGGKYRVVFDREEYDLVYASGLELMDEDHLIFKLLVSNGDLEIYSTLGGSHTIQLYSTDELVHKMPEKYSGVDSAQVARIVKDEFAGGVGYGSEIVILPEQEYTAESQTAFATVSNPVVIGEDYICRQDGYESIVTATDVYGYAALEIPDGLGSHLNVIYMDGQIMNMSGDQSGTILYIGKSEINKIDAKYIPAMQDVILKSPTGGSTKQFKITVDDSGTLTATEVG